MPLDLYDPVVSTHEWMSRDAAAEQLGVSTQTVDAYVRKRLIRSRRNEITKRTQLWRADAEQVQKTREGEA